MSTVFEREDPSAGHLYRGDFYKPMVGHVYQQYTGDFNFGDTFNENESFYHFGILKSVDVALSDSGDIGSISITNEDGALLQLSGFMYWRKNAPNEQERARLANLLDKMRDQPILVLMEHGDRSGTFFYDAMPDEKRVTTKTHGSMAEKQSQTGQKNVDFKIIHSGVRRDDDWIVDTLKKVNWDDVERAAGPVKRSHLEMKYARMLTLKGDAKTAALEPLVRGLAAVYKYKTDDLQEILFRLRFGGKFEKMLGGNVFSEHARERAKVLPNNMIRQLAQRRRKQREQTEEIPYRWLYFGAFEAKLNKGDGLTIYREDGETRFIPKDNPNFVPMLAKADELEGTPVYICERIDRAKTDTSFVDIVSATGGLGQLYESYQDAKYTWDEMLRDQELLKERQAHDLKTMDDFHQEDLKDRKSKVENIENEIKRLRHQQRTEKSNLKTAEDRYKKQRLVKTEQFVKDIDELTKKTLATGDNSLDILDRLDTLDVAMREKSRQDAAERRKIQRRVKEAQKRRQETAEKQGPSLIHRVSEFRRPTWGLGEGEQPKNLAETHPAIAFQMHPTKNGPLSPRQVTATSSKRVWWLCPDGHEYEMAVKQRAIRGPDYCMVCAHSLDEVKLVKHGGPTTRRVKETDYRQRVIRKWLEDNVKPDGTLSPEMSKIVSSSRQLADIVKSGRSEGETTPQETEAEIRIQMLQAQLEAKNAQIEAANSKAAAAEAQRNAAETREQLNEFERQVTTWSLLNEQDKEELGRQLAEVDRDAFDQEERNRFANEGEKVLAKLQNAMGTRITVNMNPYHSRKALALRLGKEHRETKIEIELVEFIKGTTNDYLVTLPKYNARIICCLSLDKRQKDQYHAVTWKSTSSIWNRIEKSITGHASIRKDVDISQYLKWNSEVAAAVRLEALKNA